MLIYPVNYASSDKRRLLTGHLWGVGPGNRVYLFMHDPSKPAPAAGVELLPRAQAQNESPLYMNASGAFAFLWLSVERFTFAQLPR